MGGSTIVWEYVRACVAGSHGVADCGPVWQLGAIGALLALAVVALLVLVAARLRGESGRRPTNGSAATGAFAAPVRANQRA